MTWNEFLDACRRWEAGRDEAVRKAFWDVRRQAGNDFYVPHFDLLARQARHAAGTAYERQVPRPEWNGEPGGGNNCRLRYIDEADLVSAAGPGGVA